MSALVAQLSFNEELKIQLLKPPKPTKSNNKHCTHAFKNKSSSKIETSKCYKCVRILKCKLRKYKLRRDGEEDPDVVDVSHILLSNLKIKSPNKLSETPECLDEIEILRPKNYLFKMARRKLRTKKCKSSEDPVNQSNDESNASPSEIQEKKKTNAFKLLMDSRNKSIGTNSPGKEKIIEPSESQEIVEKKKAKVKRNLALQKLAEAKGALKKKEMVEVQDVCIQQKMDERAERLKNMLVNSKIKVGKKITEPLKPQKKEEVLEIVDDSSNSNDYNFKHETVQEPKTLKIIDLFKDLEPSNNLSPVKKLALKEDEEFLSKLSPSLKKRENMLSYFQKIEKKSPDVEKAPEEGETIIKVKMTHKKKLLKKKRLSLAKNDVLKDHNENNSGESEARASNQVSGHVTEDKMENTERKKRKRKENSMDIETNTPEAVLAAEASETDGKRPRRSVKRPVKYNDDVNLSSSDEEVHIFTPKKKKNCETKTKKNTAVSDDIIILDGLDDISKPKKTRNQEHDKSQKKPTKLAPIFTPKPILNPEQLEAKHKFLYSGVPDQIKKIIAHQKSSSIEITNEFPTVVHVQQIGETIDHDALKTELLLNENVADDDTVTDYGTDVCLKKLIEIKLTNTCAIPPPETNIKSVLRTIKELYPKFPSYRTFRLIKDKSKGEIKEESNPSLDNSIELIDGTDDITNENPNYLNWANKYKATSTKQLLGNFDSIKDLKKWLQSWIENENRPKNTPSSDSDSSDFCYDYDSDSNSKGCIKAMNNLLVINGPVGSGKTSSVYAVASELAIKVIEVNTGSKRTGKMMLQDLQEATQSHKVNRGCSDNSQKSQDTLANHEVNNKKKRGRPKKVNEIKQSNRKDDIFSQQATNQDIGRTGMSLILIDDADIIFDQDDGFSSAITQLAQCSKRPVILVTSSLTCPHLQRFVQFGKIINLNPLPPRILGTWLDIVCLADSGACWPGLGAKFLDYFKGDIRKAINCLQFYTTSFVQNQKEEISQNSDFKLNSEDEDSNMSWTENDVTRNLKQPTLEVKDGIWKYFLNRQSNLSQLRYPSDLINVWWSVPRLLSLDNLILPDTPDSLEDVASKKSTILELQTLSNAMDSLSEADYYTCTNMDARRNITSHPWYSSESDSVTENETYNSYSNVNETTSNIIQELITGSIIAAQTTLGCKRHTTVTFPTMVAQREKDRIVSRHDSLTEILNPSAVLDRRALALDYWSACRTICRIEKDKTDVVSKRNNRFCHYLKSMNVMGGNSMFDSLANSLSSKGKE